MRSGVSLSLDFSWYENHFSELSGVKNLQIYTTMPYKDDVKHAEEMITPSSVSILNISTLIICKQLNNFNNTQ